MADHGNGEDPAFEDIEFSKKPFYWWYGKDLSEFFATVEEHGAENAYIELKKVRGKKEVYLVVKLLDSGGQVVGHYDASHVCPPDCSE